MKKEVKSFIVREVLTIIGSETWNRLQYKSIALTLRKLLTRIYSTGRVKRQPFISQTSSVTEAPSDDVEAEQEGDEDVEPARVTQ